MDTLQEALFKDMLNSGWFTDSEGDVESPTGYFGYVVNQDGDWDNEFVSAFDYEIQTEPSDEWKKANFYGVYSAFINSDGIITIHRHGDYVRTPGVAVMGIEVTPVVRAAQRWFNAESKRYQKWMES